VAKLDDILAPARAALTAGRFGPATTHRVVNGHDRTEPDAATLIAQSGESEAVYTIARVLASEVGNQPTTYAYCVAEALIREAAASSLSVLKKVTTPGAAFPTANAGYFGEQRTRYCASSKDPQKWHVEVARAALAHHDMNLSRGARRWVSLGTMDGGVQNGNALAYDADGIITKWAGDGWQWVGDIYHPTTGELLILPYKLCLLAFVGKGKVNTAPALAMVDQGRRGGPTDLSGAGRDDTGEGGGLWVAVAAAAAVAGASATRLI